MRGKKGWKMGRKRRGAGVDIPRKSPSVRCVLATHVREELSAMEPSTRVRARSRDTHSTATFHPEALEPSLSPHAPVLSSGVCLFFYTLFFIVTLLPSGFYLLSEREINSLYRILLANFWRVIDSFTFFPHVNFFYEGHDCVGFTEVFENFCPSVSAIISGEQFLIHHYI